MLQFIGQALLKLQQPFLGVFDVFRRFARSNAFLVLLLFQFRQTVLFCAWAPDCFRNTAAACWAFSKGAQGPESISWFSDAKTAYAQGRPGPHPAQGKDFLPLLLQYRTAQVIQPTRFLFDFLSRDRISDAAVPHSSSSACFRPRSFSSS